MGSECHPSKRRYDITMSKRTRKPMVKLDEEEDSFPTKVDEGKESNDRKSLKQLIHGDKKPEKTTGEESRGRNSLGEHFTADADSDADAEAEPEGKQLQLVKLQQQTGVQGLKLKRMVNRYAKVLSHLIKVKRHPRIGSTKNPVLQLTL